MHTVSITTANKRKQHGLDLSAKTEILKLVDMNWKCKDIVTKFCVDVSTVPKILSKRAHTRTHARTHTHTRRWSGTTRVGRYQKSKTNLDFTEARDSEWQWHHLGHMQVCTALQTDNHASTPPLKFFTGQTPFLPPNQQRQSTEGTEKRTDYKKFSDVVVVNAYQENEKQLLR